MSNIKSTNEFVIKFANATFPKTSKISCGVGCPSTIKSPLLIKSPSLTFTCLPLGTKYIFSFCN